MHRWKRHSAYLKIIRAECRRKYSPTYIIDTASNDHLAAEYSNRNFKYDDLDPIAIIDEDNEGVGGIS
jgi:hypothetical protein